MTTHLHKKRSVNLVNSPISLGKDAIWLLSNVHSFDKVVSVSFNKYQRNTQLYLMSNRHWKNKDSTLTQKKSCQACQFPNLAGNRFYLVIPCFAFISYSNGNVSITQQPSKKYTIPTHDFYTLKEQGQQTYTKRDIPSLSILQSL